MTDPPPRPQYRLVDFLGFTPLAHRPPLPRWWWAYCAIAYLAPSLLLATVPAKDMRGAVAGLTMGTVLFTAIQLLVALNLEAEDWRITVPMYTAYGTVAIAVGWLSQQPHQFYGRAIEGERVAVIRQLAVTMRHEVAALAHSEDRRALQTIIAMTRRIRDSIDRVVNVTHAPVTDYLPGVRMIDLAKLDEPAPDAGGRMGSPSPPPPGG